MLTRCLVAALVVLPSVVFAQSPIPIYVFTTHDATGLVALEDTSKERTTAVADMKKRLAKNQTVRLVDTPEAATVTIEVVGAGMEWTRQGAAVTTYIGNGQAVTRQGPNTPEASSRAMLRSGTFETQIDASLGPFGRSYGENLARKVETWLEKNRATLTAAPPAP